MPTQAAEHFQDLLGKWHDRRVMVRDLKKALNKGSLVPEEKQNLGKILSELTSDCDSLLEQINGFTVAGVLPSKMAVS